MTDPWVTIRCPACSRTWEADPTELPAPDEDFQCTSCDSRDSTGAFMETERGLSILKTFHEE